MVKLPSNWRTLLVLALLGGALLIDVAVSLVKGVVHPNALIVGVGIFLLWQDGVFKCTKCE